MFFKFDRDGLEVIALACGLGVLSQSIQILLLRQFLTISQSGELVMGGALSVWLVAWGVGSLLGGASLGPSRVRGRWWSLFGLCGCGWASILAMVSARELLDLPRHSPLGIPSALGVAVLIMTPPALGAGLIFGCLTRGLSAAASRAIYVVESMGSLGVGVFLSTPFWERLGLTGVFLGLTVVLCVIRALILLLASAQPRPAVPASTPSGAATRWPASAWACALGAPVIVVVSIVWSTPLLQRPWEYSMPGSKVVERRELRQGEAVALERQGQVDIFLGGHHASSWPARQERESLASLVLLQHEKPERMLLWGGRAALLAGPSGVLGAREVVVLTEDRSVLEFECRHFFGLARELERPGVTIIEAELRAFLKGSPGRFDAMILDGPDPSTALANRIFTAEGLSLARKALAPGGVLGLPLASSSSAGTLGPAFRERNLVLIGTLKSIFDEVLAVPGEEELLLARRLPAVVVPGRELCLDGGVLARRLAARPGLRFLTEPQIEESVPRIATMRLANTYRQASAGEFNTDDRPRGYILTGRAEAQTSATGGRACLVGLIVFGLELAGLTVLLFANRGDTRKDTGRVLGSLAIVSFVGMVDQVLIFLTFQTSFGLLYREIGLITGLALGGVAVGSSSRLDQSRWSRPVATLCRLSLLVAGSSLLVALLPHAARVANHPAWLYPGLLSMATWMGMLGGRAYACALKEASWSPSLAPKTYSADMLGAALGALSTAGLLAPALGFSLTASVAASLAVLAAWIAPRPLLRPWRAPDTDLTL